MKKIIFMAVMLLGVNASYGQHAQNDFSCDIVVTQFCYNATSCAVTAGPFASQTIPPSPPVTSLSVNTCPSGDLTGYIISYPGPTNCLQTTIVGDPSVPLGGCWSTTAKLPDCNGCNNGNDIDIFFSVTRDLHFAP